MLSHQLVGFSRRMNRGCWILKLKAGSPSEALGLWSLTLRIHGLMITKMTSGGNGAVAAGFASAIAMAVPSNEK